MAEVAIIIGNGFDLDLGLPSRYSDFMNSQEFKRVYQSSRSSFREGENSLLDYLLNLSFESNWFDMEAAIHDFIATEHAYTQVELSLVESEFRQLRTALCNYLTRVSSSFKANENRLAYKFMVGMKQCPLNYVWIFFNYTNPYTFTQPIPIFPQSTSWFTYVHGSLRDKDIVLGCDIQPNELVNRQLSFMYKYNMLKNANHVARNLLEAKEVIFWGHSVNEMDFCYFREFFKQAGASPTPIRHITFITLDENSERNIKDNIRNQGINVTDLYNNLWTFKFIHTKKLYAEDKEEMNNWNEMFARLLAKDRHGL